MTPIVQLSLFDKRCPQCDTLKPRELFGRDSKAKDGLFCWCKPCAKAYSRAYYVQHAEQCRRAALETHRKNRARHRDYNRRWSAAHRERIRAHANSAHSSVLRSLRHEKDPQRLRDRARTWQRQHHGYRLLQGTARYQRVRAAGPLYTMLDVNTLYIQQKGMCYYCGVSLEVGYHVDHKVPLSRGGTHARINLALACPLCNHRKWTRTETEFRAWRELRAQKQQKAVL
jgi:5-methylcytosine-specific restriction endonuclease McrA